MNIYFFIAIFLFLSVIFFWISIIIKTSRKKRLTLDRRRYYKKILKQISSNISSKEKIIDYDKMYHKVLIDLWYTWSFWDILKQYPNEIDNINWVWELHKMRNKLVHEFDLLDENVLKKMASKYKKEIEKLIK